MSNLIVEFADGWLNGIGVDIIGPFSLTEHLQDGTIIIRKQYRGQHAIDYHGTSVGEGIYCGNWSYSGYVGGKWSIHMKSVVEGAEDEITEIR
jgi:hypothetical protein